MVGGQRYELSPSKGDEGVARIPEGTLRSVGHKSISEQQRAKGRLRRYTLYKVKETEHGKTI